MEAAMVEARDVEDRKLRIGIVWNGVEKHEEVKEEETIQAVLARAIRLFHITQQPHLLSLFVSEGNDARELDDNSTVKQNGLTSESILYLRPSRVKGGASR